MWRQAYEVFEDSWCCLPSSKGKVFCENAAYDQAQNRGQTAAGVKKNKAVCQLAVFC